VSDRADADYVLVSHLQYFEQPPPGCTLERSVRAAGAPLVDTYLCHPGSPAQLGFAAMGRNATDEAFGHFRDALQRDPHDPAGLFGMGWVAQTRGELEQAELLYVQAASRAGQTGDAETEYFARFDLGTLYAQESRNEQAVEAFHRALAVTERAPRRFADRSWTLWLNLGRSLAATGRPAEAREALLRASQLRPNDPAIGDALRLLPAPRDAGPDGH
jgi:tetratricopeptide (TPR) repeat protein